MAGLTAAGLVIRTQPELEQLLRATILEAIPGIDLDDGPEQQFISILAELLAEQWEALQALYGGFQGRADGIMADWLAAITGTLRRAATRTRVPTAKVNLDAGFTLPAGRVASIEGNPDAQFRLVDAVTNPGDTAADVDAVFEAIATGPVAAPAGKLTVIVTAASGWNAVTNIEDGEKGKLRASDAELAAQRVLELGARGRQSYRAIRAAVARVPGVISVFIYGNETSSTVSGRPPKSFEVVVWDAGGEADSGAIRAAILAAKPAGILAYGTNTATVEDDDGQALSIGFTRATVLRVYVATQAILAANAGSEWASQLAAALHDRSESYTVGQKAYASQLVQAGLDNVPSVEAIPALTIGTAPSPAGAVVTPTYAQIVRISTGDVDATEAP